MIVDEGGRWCLIHSSARVTQCSIIMSAMPHKLLIKQDVVSRDVILQLEATGSSLCVGNHLPYGTKTRHRIWSSSRRKESCLVARSDPWTPWEKKRKVKRELSLKALKYHIIWDFQVCGTDSCWCGGRRIRHAEVTASTYSRKRKI